MAKMKMYVCSQSEYLEPFRKTFNQVPSIKDADVVMFTGGADVHPRLYNEPVGRRTFTHEERDIWELERARYAINKGLPMLGICRGAQFLTVMAGGRLVQDVTDHGRYHHCYTTDDDPGFVMSSTHHQMMHPFNLDKDKFDVIAFARHRSKHYLDGNNRAIPHSGIEPEIVWYPKIKALCIQGHPEIMEAESEGVHYCQSLVKDYLCA